MACLAVFAAALGIVLMLSTPQPSAFGIALVALLLIGRLATSAVNPKRVLLAASGFVVIGLLVSETYWGQLV